MLPTLLTCGWPHRGDSTDMPKRPEGHKVMAILEGEGEQPVLGFWALDVHPYDPCMP